jgi:hypothetical protein
LGSADPIDWDSLPAAEEATPEYPPDDTRQINPPEGVCEFCGEEIVREEGKKGRLPKAHPECREHFRLEQKAARAAAGVSRGPRPVRVSAKDRLAAEEVEQALETARKGMLKAVGLMMLVDPYDAFVLHINSPDIIENLRPVLMRFPWLREQASGASVGASVFGLVIAIGTTLLPIAAHHKLIPGKLVTQILTQLPFVMQRMQEALKDNGEDLTTTLMRRVKEQQAKEEAARRYAQTSEPVDASTR